MYVKMWLDGSQHLVISGAMGASSMMKLLQAVTAALVMR
jgi:hypothetical protein